MDAILVCLSFNASNMIMDFAKKHTKNSNDSAFLSIFATPDL